MCGIQKNGTNEPICWERIETQLWKMDMRIQEGRKGWDELREQHGHIYTLPRVKQTAREKLLYNAGSSAWCRDDAEGRNGVGGGREVQEGGGCR